VFGVCLTLTLKFLFWPLKNNQKEERHLFNILPTCELASSPFEETINKAIEDGIKKMEREYDAGKDELFFFFFCLVFSNYF